MDITTTAAILLFSISIYLFAWWRSSRPVKFGKVRIIPWETISMLAMLVALFMLVHIFGIFKEYRQ